MYLFTELTLACTLFPGKLLGCFAGKCSGSIRSIVRHPELPLIASCGKAAYFEKIFFQLFHIHLFWAQIYWLHVFVLHTFTSLGYSVCINSGNQFTIVGLDSYLRIWDTNTRQLLSAVRLTVNFIVFKYYIFHAINRYCFSSAFICHCFILDIPYKWIIVVMKTSWASQTF